MTKIIAGVAGLVTTVALVGASAFAQFTTTVTASNVTFATGTAALEIKYPVSPTPQTGWSSAGEFNFFNNNLGKFVPGVAKSDSFSIRNRGDVSLSLNLRLTEAPQGNWAGLKDVMQLRIYSSTNPPAGDNGYITFDGWNAVGGVNLSVNLSPVDANNAGVEMKVDARLSPSATDSVKNEFVTTTWVLTGTQI